MVKLSKNLTFLAVMAVVALITATVIDSNLGLLSRKSQEKILTSQEASEKALKFINENLLEKGMTASLVGVSEESGLYKIKLKIGEEEYDSYVTTDGKFLFPQPPIELKTETGQPSDGASGEIPKEDRPDVKLFVMSHCPYGLQVQKMFLPVYDLLKNEADMGVYFVNYIMHDKKELDENLRQYCIQKEEKDKYADYLGCFVQDGNSEKCLSNAKINKTKLDSCVVETDNEYKVTEQYNDQSTWLNGSYPKFDVQAGLNEKYGVKGSPTIVINGVVADIGPRSPEKFKETICQAFSQPPASCSQTLSNEASSPGFGSGAGSSSGGQCK